MTTVSSSSFVTTLPGDLVDVSHPNLKLGPGLLLQQPDASSSSTNVKSKTVVTTRAGALRSSTNGRQWWVESNSRRYVPAPQEFVVGIVTGKMGENWRVDIGGAHPAVLDGYAFEGATKRNKPNLKINSLVYARVSLAHKDMDPELECFDAQTRKSEGFGELKGGFLIRCSLGMCRQLLDPAYYLLPLLGSRVHLETAIGMNGRVWVDTKSPKHTIAVARCMHAADPDGGGLDDLEVKKLISTMEL